MRDVWNHAMELMDKTIYNFFVTLNSLQKYANQAKLFKYTRATESLLMFDNVLRFLIFSISIVLALSSLIGSSFVEGRLVADYNQSAHIDPVSGEFIVVGEIQNEGCRSIHNVHIGIEFYDSTRAIFYKYFAPISIGNNNTTIVGESKLPFQIRISNEIAQKIMSYSFYAYKEGNYAEKETGLQIISNDMKLVEINSDMNYTRWNISGEISNVANQIAMNVRVVGALYGEDGRVVGVAGYAPTDLYPSTLKTEERRSFSIEGVIPLSFEPKSFYVYADSDNVSFKTKYACWPPVQIGLNGDIVNENGESIKPVAGQKLFIPIELLNQVEREQGFAYFLQVKDENGFTAHLSWISGTLQKDQHRKLAQEWTAEKPGRYTVEILVWSSDTDPVPISPKVTMEVSVEK